MKSTRRIVVLFSVAALLAPAAVASFQAADLIYVASVAHSSAADEGFWRTDFFVTNVSDVPIDVAVAYLPSGGTSNAYLLSDRSRLLGGREEDGFGLVNEDLADIPPNGSARINDIVADFVSEFALPGVGGMIVWAYEAGTLQDDSSRVHKDAIVNTRTYNDTVFYVPDPDSHDEFVEVPASFGQSFPGVPWYNLADPAAVTEDYDFSFMVLIGGQETDDFRYNFGILNASDPQTVVNLRMQPYQPNGEPYLDEDGNEIFETVSLPTLAHYQWFRVYPLLFGIEDDVEESMIKVSFTSWQSSSPEPRPAFLTWGSIVDWRSGDPASVMGAFGYPYNIECMWPGDDGGEGAIPGGAMGAGSKSARSTRRMIDLPPAYSASPPREIDNQ
jgi:hypothetical protein